MSGVIEDKHMTPQQIVGLAARLFSIWLALLALGEANLGLLDWYSSRSNHDAALYVHTIGYYVMATLFLGFAFLLWFFPMTIAHKLVPRTKFEDTLSLPARQAVVVACVVLGLFVIVWRALPILANYLSLAAIWIANGQPISIMAPKAHIQGLIGLIQFIVGLFLVVKAHTLAAKIMPSSNTTNE
jgi:hypothetical protein